MKIQGLTTTNYMKLSNIHIDMDASPLHVVCGPNESGKSTLAETIRFAFLGDSPRVRLKKDYQQLLTAGSKKGSVTVRWDGLELTRQIKTGTTDPEDYALDKLTEQCLHLVLGAQRFTTMDIETRRKLLFKICNVKSSKDD